MKRGTIITIVVILVAVLLAVLFWGQITGSIILRRPVITYISAREVTAEQGTLCHINNIKADDNQYAGLASGVDDGIGVIDGKRVNSCINLDFNETYEVLGVEIKYRTVKSTCGDDCEGEDCGIGGKGYIFFKGEEGWRYIKAIPRNTEVEVKKFWDKEMDVKNVLVCRKEDWHKRDNLEIDYVKLMVDSKLLE